MKRHFSLLIILSGLIIATAILLFLLNFTNPSAIGPLGILLVFVLIYIVSLMALLLLMRLGEAIYRAIRSQPETVVSRERSRILRKRLALSAAVLSFIPIFMISLNSIGQLNFADVALVVVIEALAIFYIIRRI